MKLPRTTWTPGEGPRPDDGWLKELDAEMLVDVGVMLFERGQGFEAHEAWELAWRAAKAERRADDERVLRALVKLAAAMVKVRQGNPIGVHEHARGARALLDELAVEECLGFSIPGLRALAARVEDSPGEARPVGEAMFGKLPRAPRGGVTGPRG